MVGLKIYGTVLAVTIGAVVIPTGVISLLTPTPDHTFWDEPLNPTVHSPIPLPEQIGELEEHDNAEVIRVYSSFYKRYRKLGMTDLKAQEEAEIQLKLRGCDPKTIKGVIQKTVRIAYEASANMPIK